MRYVVLLVLGFIGLPLTGWAETGFIQAVDQARPDHSNITDSSSRRILQEFQPRVYVDPRSYKPMSFSGITSPPPSSSTIHEADSWTPPTVGTFGGMLTGPTFTWTIGYPLLITSTLGVPGQPPPITDRSMLIP